MIGRAPTSCFGLDPASFEASAAASVKCTGNLNDMFEIGDLCNKLGIRNLAVVETFRGRCFHSAWYIYEGRRYIVRGYKLLK